MVWAKAILFFVSIFILMFIFNKIMTRVMKVEKKNIFSNRYVNDLHKKIGGILPIMFFIISIVFNMWQIEHSEFENISLYFLGFVIIFFVLDALVRAFMEWKYATNRMDYIYTLSEMLFMIIVIFACAKTYFSGFMN
ncbi:DUF4181 domain-containing protein [Psychrobacillus sp. NPDC096389]|uniref:DUF4181 domain-containing protein n=1 Tax=Psychrobacillus sp. NPDC096389 TaxID=3364490 RepID=UPI003807478E